MRHEPYIHAGEPYSISAEPYIDTIWRMVILTQFEHQNSNYKYQIPSTKFLPSNRDRWDSKTQIINGSNITLPITIRRDGIKVKQKPLLNWKWLFFKIHYI